MQCFVSCGSFQVHKHIPMTPPAADTSSLLTTSLWSFAELALKSSGGCSLDRIRHIRGVIWVNLVVQVRKVRRVLQAIV